MKRIPLKASPRPSARVRRARRVGAGWLVESLESRTLLSVSPQVSGALDSDFLSPVEGAVSVADVKNPPSPICTTSTSTAANVNTDCEDVPGPHNETSIAVNPTNPLNMISSANDYQLVLNPGGHISQTTYSRAHVTFDGGQTWSLYPVSFDGYKATGDPAIAFDAAGRAYMTTLGFVWNSSSNVTSPDILVANSPDGGQTWSSPVRVAQGTGSSASAGKYNDKEFVAAWGNDNAIVTWTIFNRGPSGNYINSPIYASVTHDGGQTWTPAAQISGPDGLYSQGSTPIVAADGSIYVSFLNGDDDVAPQYRDHYKVVKVDPVTGRALGAPVDAGLVYDGVNDYPININGRETLQDSQFRTWSVGNMTTDPTNAKHLAVIWPDMRNNPYPDAVLPSSDPYRVRTNSDVVVSQSFDGGKTWNISVIARPNDQFQPWGAFDATGHLQIGVYDRSYDPSNHQYDYTLASQTNPGAPTPNFTFKQVTTAHSDPTKNDRWFSGVTVNSSFPHPTTFLGDYSGIAVIPGGKVATTWTDMRESVTFTTRTGSGEDAYFGVVDPATASALAAAASTPAVPAMAQAVDTVLIPLDGQTSDGWLETLFAAKGKRQQHSP
jgi:hypothetical protein